MTLPEMIERTETQSVKSCFCATQHFHCQPNVCHRFFHRSQLEGNYMQSQLAYGSVATPAYNYSTTREGSCCASSHTWNTCETILFIVFHIPGKSHRNQVPNMTTCVGKNRTHQYEF